MSAPKTFTSDKIRTSEICGLDGGAVTICGLNLTAISGNMITGESLTISGDSSSIVHMNSGVFDYIKTNEIIVDGTGTFTDLIINGVKYIPRKHIGYGFYFGGPPISVPERLPLTTGTPTFYSGLHTGTNYIFVKDVSSFASGDHVIINPGGVYSDGDPQEEHTISTTPDYVTPTDCCNAKVSSTVSAGGSSFLHLNEANGGFNFEAGDTITINGNSTVYTVSASDVSSSTKRYVNISPNLVDDATENDCICLVQPTLTTTETLSNFYLPGTYVANKHSAMVSNQPSSPVCSGSCYDSQYLYLERGVYTGEFDWYLTGYREYFVDFSGVEVHATGNNTSGILTLVYPDTGM